jgi:hypothetical protein
MEAQVTARPRDHLVGDLVGHLDRRRERHLPQLGKSVLRGGVRVRQQRELLVDLRQLGEIRARDEAVRRRHGAFLH